MNIKIAYIVSTLLRCGPTNQLYNLVKYLDRNVYCPTIITLSPEPQNSMWQDFEKIGIKPITINLSRLKSLFFAASKLKNILSKLDIDIVHTQGFRANIIAAKHLSNYKTVATLRNSPFHDYSMKYGKLKGYFIAQYHLKILKKTDSPVTVSQSTAKFLTERSSFTIKVIQNGVDTESFCPSLESNTYKRHFRQKVGMPLDKTVFISVGDFIHLKNHIAIIKAFQDKEIKKNCCIVFLGDGPLMNSCKQRAKNDDHIKFYGRVTNVSEYLQASDFFISVSQTEGLPNAVLEAMACGLPCIVSDIPSHREILTFNQKAGTTVPVEYTEEFTKKIIALLNADHAQMSKAALCIVQKHLNARKMSEKYQELYKQLS